MIEEVHTVLVAWANAIFGELILLYEENHSSLKAVI
jgi:hypothetical protein